MSASKAKVTRLSVEHFREPIGIGTPEPRLSWQISGDPSWMQQSYDIRITRDTAEPAVASLVSDQQILVPWPANALRARERAEVSVRLTGQDGTSTPWSEPLTVEAGLLNARDWVAQPVSGAWAEESGSDRRPSRVRKRLTVPADLTRATLYASAHGVFEVEINGRRVGDEALAPGWTNYRSRLRYRAYDVTSMLTAGDNVLGAWLGDGWFRGRLGFNGGYHDIYGEDLAFIGQLELMTSDGSRTVIATDESWQAEPSPILFSGLYDGERYDRRVDSAAWSTIADDRTTWTPVAVGVQDMAAMIAADGPPVRATEVVEPVRSWKSPEGTWLFDFGQNLVGRLAIPVPPVDGVRITARHAEVMQDGELYRRPLRLAASEDTVIGDGTDFVWEPRFTLHGFRFAEIEGLGDTESAPRVVARVYHTDMERTGWFDSSDPLINRLHENVRWSMRGNFVDLPTDCPQRDERLGWTGDIQVFSGTASFLYDCSGMLSSWLQDLASEQDENGNVPWFVPWIPGGPTWDPPQPSAVWGDAAVLVPAVLFDRFADAALLRRQYDSATAWVDLVTRMAGPERVWRNGQQLGDWLDPIAPPDDPADAATDRYLVATAYFAYSARRLSEIADVLGETVDARRYGALADEVRDAFIATFVTKEQRLTSDAQTAYSLAIVFDLVPLHLAQAFGDRLAELVAEAGNRIGTGFAGTPLVSDALTRTGHSATAYALLLERECPSWLYTVLQGGTTIWERWDSLQPDGTVNPGEMTSFNHYALGAVADWLHRTVAGLAPSSPGYRTITFAPTPGGGLTWASARHLCPYGEITSAWRIEDGTMYFEVSLPIGTSGAVRLPDGGQYRVGPGRHRFTASLLRDQVEASGVVKLCAG